MTTMVNENGPWFLQFPGPVHPYVRTTQRQKWVDRRYKAYQIWKQTFRAYADSKSFPELLDKDKTYRLYCTIYTMGRARYDIDNALKGILDALWEQDNKIKEMWAKLRENWFEDSVTLSLEVII